MHTVSDGDDGGLVVVEQPRVGRQQADVVAQRCRLPVEAARQPDGDVHQAQRQRHAAVVEHHPAAVCGTTTQSHSGHGLRPRGQGAHLRPAAAHSNGLAYDSRCAGAEHAYDVAPRGSEKSGGGASRKAK